MWNEIKNEHDIEEFMNIVNEFSNSCIKEMRYISGGYVNANDLSMYAVSDVRELRIIFHRQYEDIYAFEMKFIGVSDLIMHATDLTDCVIYDSTFIKNNNMFYWFDYEDGDTENIYKEGTCVVAEKVFWREINSL